MSYEKRLGSFGGFCTLAIACLTACGEGGGEPVTESQTRGTPFSIDSAIAELKAIHPQANVRVQGSRIRRVYGVAATGNTPRMAAENFRKNSAAAFGVDPTDLVPSRLSVSPKIATTAATATDGVGLMHDRSTGKYKFRLFTYEQQRDGIPVFRSGLRTLVREDGQNPVVWANTDVRPMGDFRPQASARTRPDLDKSLGALRANGAFAHRTRVAPAAFANLSTPTPTIFAGAGKNTVPPRMAMQYTAEGANGAGKWTFVADAATGDILHVESNLHFDIGGTVRGEVIAGHESMECGTLGVAPFAHAEVTSSAGNAFTNATGAFNIVQSGGGTFNVVSSVTGQFFDVSTEAGSLSSISLTVTPPGPANFLHEDPETPPEFVLAQLNAYKQANELRDLLLTHVPDYPTIATQTNFPITVNRTDMLCLVSGGAWYDNDSAERSINFCQRNVDIANLAFGSIVYHEYGHHIVDTGGSGQNEYGEGMADTIAMLVSKDPRIGVGYHFENCAEPLRNVDNDCQYSETECSSCGPGNYECSLVLSGTIWDIWQELDATDPANSGDIIRSLVFSSVPLHTGTHIDPSIAIDLLTLDDDDALVENGTPHYEEICAGFAAHGMDCPPIVDGLVVRGVDLDSEGPSDGPFEPTSVSYTLHNLGPEETITYSVAVNAPWLTVDGTGGTIPLGEQVTVTVSIDQTQAALLADGHYTAEIDFENETSGVGNVTREAKLQVGAPVPIYTATFDDGLEGYTADTEYDNVWHHSTACQDALPGHTTGGHLYYGKDTDCDYRIGTPIRHTITSPSIRIDNPLMSELGFNYFLQTEDDPNFDDAEVLVSVNGGAFQVVASNNGGGVELEETTAWQELRAEIWQLLPSSGSANIRIQLAFNAVDPDNNDNRGFAVDDITVYAQPQSATNAFVEVSGRVVMEAENFTASTPRSSHRWDERSNAQASGQAVMTANPNLNQFINANFASTSPELTYPVRFSTTGTYYVWVRGIGPTANDDSCHVGVNGAAVSTADRITGFTSGLSWTRNTIDGAPATISVTQAGVYDINLWMREDGFSVDKILLTTNANYFPYGNGPGESAHEGQTQRPCASYCSNPVTFSTSSYNAGNLGTAATCHETTADLNGGVCGNFVNPRRLLVNGVQMPCNWSPWPSLPAAENGGYCIQTTSGNHPWASFTTW